MILITNNIDENNTDNLLILSEFVIKLKNKLFFEIERLINIFPGTTRI